MKLHTLLSVADFERRAQALLPRAVLGYVNGGTEDGLTLQANRDALRAVQFRPKGLVGVAERSQRVTLWGRSYAHPFGIAPMGVTAMCRHRCEQDLALAAARHGRVLAAVPRDFPVLIDGGFRRGTDILKAMALGARMVFLGRAMLYGAAVAGQAGVARVIDILGTEIDRNLGLLGCHDVNALDQDFIVRLRAGHPGMQAGYQIL